VEVAEHLAPHDRSAEARGGPYKRVDDPVRLWQGAGVSRWMRAHPLRVLGAATLLLMVVGVLGTYYAPRAHLGLFVILISGIVMPQLGKNRR